MRRRRFVQCVAVAVGGWYGVEHGCAPEVGASGCPKPNDYPILIVILLVCAGVATVDHGELCGLTKRQWPTCRWSVRPYWPLRAPEAAAGRPVHALSQSAAGDGSDLPVAELQARYLPELETLLPAARGAAVPDFFVTRE